MLPPATYVELRAHTAFSFGDGAVTPEALAARAAALGYDTLGLTDAADLGGIIRFALSAKERGIRPIIGAELVVDGRPMALIARTSEGYRNIAALVTRARSGALEDWTPESIDAPQRGRPRVTWRDLAEHSAGAQALTGPASGEIAALLHAGRAGEADRALARWHDVFGDHLAVEVQLHHAGRAEEALAGALIELAERRGVPWVVTNDPRYIDHAGRLAHDVLTALRADLTLREAAERGVLHPNGEWCLQSPHQVARKWRGREQGLVASRRIAESCGFDLSWLRPPLPDFPVPANHTIDSFLRACVLDGARERWGNVLSDRQRSQLDHELDLIARLGFSGFFLVMWDAVAEAHRNHILCQGRGSAANSAVAYCLGVTAVDPIKHGLLFERFLSEMRVDGKAEAPDIDVDVEHDRREELLDYVYSRWRRECAAITAMVQTYRAPNAVLDSMRAFGYPPQLATSLSKRLHYAEPATAVEALEGGLAAQFGLDVTSSGGRTLLAAIAAFQDLPRMRSTHPGGFVLSAASLGDYCPVEPTAMGRTVIQFDKDDLDWVGIPKFDFLGLGALSMVRRAFDIIEVRTGTRPSMYQLPPDDVATFEMIARGDTVGTFQIESRAQIASLVHTRPDRMYDIVVQVALIRPGPIQARFVRPYTLRRRGQEPVSYVHPALQPILQRTQGIPIFQEQAMALAMALGGYSGAEADELRRTMGNNRKLPRLVAALERLRVRMIEREVTTEVADRIVDDLRSFANYGFPESHAWSFALIAYATAYLKAHHPAAFYCGLLNAWPMGFYSPSTLVHDARRHGVEVRAPCLVRGREESIVEDASEPTKEAFRVGWRHVIGLGERSLERIAVARESALFTSITDVVARAQLTRAESAALARAGAFGAWEPERRRAAWEALRAAGDTLPLAPAITDGADDGFAPRALHPVHETLIDYAAVGLSVTGHPMECLRPWCRRVGVLDSSELARQRDRSRVVVAGMVTIRQQPQTSKGTVFLLLEDEHGTVNIIIPKPIVEPNREPIRHSTFLAVYGRLERQGDGDTPLLNVIAEKFHALDDRAAAAARAAGLGTSTRSGAPPGPRDDADDTRVLNRSRDFR